MAGKLTIQRSIDALASLEGGDTINVEAIDFAPPVGRAVDEGPENLVLGSALVRSAITPEASISATWEVLIGIIPDQFIVQISTDSAFPDDNTRTLFTPGDQPSITIASLKTDTTYYVHVALVRQATQSIWSDAVSEATPNDTAAPDPVTSAAYDFTSGDLLLSWTNPASDNFRVVRMDIYASNGGTHLHTLETAVGHYTYLAAQNLVDTSGAGDPSLYVVLTAVSWFGVDSTPVNLSPVKAAPSAPSGLATSWDSDTGAVGPDLKVTWTSANYIDHYVLTLDGVARMVSGKTNQYTYTLDANRFEHSGTPDKVVSISLVAVDALGQAGSASTATATNAAPAAPAVSATAHMAQAQATITSTPPGDFDVYEFVWKDSGGSTVRTAYSQSATDIYQATLLDTYSVVVRTRDVFGSYSSTTTIGSLEITLTLTSLREDSSYSDSISTDFSSAPNSTVLKDDATGAGISYASSAGAWRWTRITYPLIDRFRRISLAPGSGDANFYIGLSLDDVAYTWYSGSLTGIVLATVANEAAAQAAAPLFSALSGGYAELPATVEARSIVIGHRNTTTGYRIDEAYGQRLIIADVIKVGQLSAITADMGELTAGTITGALIRTAASGARLQLTSSAFEGYTASDKFLTLNPTDGISITVDTTAANPRAYTFNDGAGNFISGMYSWQDATQRTLEIDASPVIGKTTAISLLSFGNTEAAVSLWALVTGGGGGVAKVDLAAGVAGDFITLDADNIKATGGLNVGPTTVGAAAGKIKASGYFQGGVFFQGASDLITQDNTNLFWDDTNNILHVGGSATIAGTPRLAIKGGPGDGAAGPHVGTYTSADIYPLMHFLSFAHDNMEMSWDAYYDAGGWKSSDAGSNFQIRKNGDVFSVCVGSGTAAGSALTWQTADAMTITGARTWYLNTALTVGTGQHLFNHSTSGTPGVGFGTDFVWNADTNGGSLKLQSFFRSVWTTATDASRKARASWHVADTAIREGMRIEASGTAPMIGLYGVAAVVQAAAITSPSGGATIDTQARTAIDAIRTAIKNIGITA